MRPRSPDVHPVLSLAWLLEPLSVDTFLDEIWGTDHHHIARGRADYFNDLFPQPSTPEGLLELFRHDPSGMRLVRGQDKKGPDNYRLADGSRCRMHAAAGEVQHVTGFQQQFCWYRQTHAEPSVHLTVGIHAPTVLMLAIGALHSQSFRDDRLNARLPPRHLDDRDLEATIRDLVRDAIAEVDDSAALDDGLGLLVDALVRRGTCPPVGKITSATAIDGQT